MSHRGAGSPSLEPSADGDRRRPLDPRSNAARRARARCTLLVYGETPRAVFRTPLPDTSTLRFLPSHRGYIHHQEADAFYSDRERLSRLRSRQSPGGEGISQFAVPCATSTSTHLSQTPGQGARRAGKLTSKTGSSRNSATAASDPQKRPVPPRVIADYNRASPKPRACVHDAHGPLLAGEDRLPDFTLQSLVDHRPAHGHYKRGLTSSTHRKNRRLRGSLALVSEAQEGTVTIRAMARALQPSLAGEARLRSRQSVADQAPRRCFRVAAYPRPRSAASLPKGELRERSASGLEASADAIIA